MIAGYRSLSHWDAALPVPLVWATTLRPGYHAIKNGYPIRHTISEDDIFRILVLFNWIAVVYIPLVNTKEISPNTEFINSSFHNHSELLPNLNSESDRSCGSEVPSWSFTRDGKTYKASNLSFPPISLRYFTALSRLGRYAALSKKHSKRELKASRVLLFANLANLNALSDFSFCEYKK